MKKYKEYMARRKSPGVDLFNTGTDEKGGKTGRKCDIILKELKEEVATEDLKPRKYDPWISERTLQLVKEKKRAMGKGQEDLVQNISKEIRRNMRKDWKERI